MNDASRSYFFVLVAVLLIIVLWMGYVMGRQASSMEAYDRGYDTGYATAEAVSMNARSFDYCPANEQFRDACSECHTPPWNDERVSQE